MTACPHRHCSLNHAGATYCVDCNEILKPPVNQAGNEELTKRMRNDELQRRPEREPLKK